MLYLHRAERADRLADVLAGILADPPADPFAPEVVSVPTRGIERWLVQRLSGRLGISGTPSSGDGVCANVEFPFPGRLVGGALALASGIEPEQDPWLPERMVWPLLEVVQDAIEEPWLTLLARHLESGRERRFARLRRLAHLFDEYSVRRPELLVAWARGEDPQADRSADWQAELWRRLRERIGVPSGAERLAPASQRLRDEPELVALPDRLTLFGLTRIPAGYLQVLQALAVARDVHLMLLHPSPVLWERVSERTGSTEPVRSLPLRAEDPTAGLGANRLLASWGRDSRELQLVLTAAGEGVDSHHDLPQDPEPTTLLGRLQADVHADRPAPGEPLPDAPDERLLLAQDDNSVRIHACHGRARQVEVLREAILHRLADDPTLEPRDIIVMCPDIEAFAPLIQATFGASADIGAVDLRVRLADRSLRQVNPLLSVAARLLDLAQARLTASEVLDLADTEPVRRRFRLDDDELAQVQSWIADAGIHWGLDAAHRRDFKLEMLDAGTWRTGLRRLLLGVALGEADRRRFAGTLPLDAVDSGGIELAGRFAELVDRLGAALDALTQPQTVAAWARELEVAVDALTATGDQDAWQRRELDRLLGGVSEEADPAAALTLPEIRALLADRLAGRPTRANFRSGHLTVCTLVPMRSVPHRVVCLLGLDDGAFPRHTARDGDNLLLAQPRVGDRDPRSEDRQLLLDALLAAQEALIITYSGRDERTNAELPPAVPVGELFDAIDATARCPDGPARRRVLVRHPLQPFDPRNFTAGELNGTEPWAFDPVALDGARALAQPRSRAVPFLLDPLPAPADAQTLALGDLIQFARQPVLAFLRQRLGLTTGARGDDIADGLPVELDSLATWQVGQNLLDGLLAGIPHREVALAEIARGTLPPGALGEPVIADAWPPVEAIATRAGTYGADSESATLETNVVLPGGVRLTGTVSGIHGNVLLSVSYSRLGPLPRIAAWVSLLALTAAHPDIPYEAITIGRGSRPRHGDDDRVGIARIPPLARDADGRRRLALEELGKLAALRAEGMREPLPLPARTAAEYARVALQGGDALAAALKVWTTTYERRDGEDAKPEHQLAFAGELPPIEALGRYALALWEPLLIREQLEEYEQAR